jgi:hypothetical protein
MDETQAVGAGFGAVGCIVGLVVGLVFGLVGWAVGKGKGKGGLGFVLGFFLGIIGVLIVAFMGGDSSSGRVRSRRVGPHRALRTPGRFRGRR